MKDLHAQLIKWLRTQAGQDLVEYALLVALIAIVAVLAVTGAGQKVVDVFTSITSQIPS